MSWISAKLVSFAVSRPMGQQMLQGSLNIPAGDSVEKDLPDFFDGFTKAVHGAPQDKDNLPARFDGAPVADVTTDLLEKLSKQTDPHQPDVYQMGYSLLPCKIEQSSTPGIFAVDLAPADFRFTTKSMAHDPVARLFVDTTPGQDGIEYLLSY